MPSSLYLLAAAAAALFTPSLAYPKIPVVRNVGNNDLVARQASSTSAAVPVATSSSGSSSGFLEIKLTNSASDQVYAYIIGMDYNNNERVFYQTGSSAWYYITTNGATLNATTNLYSIDTASNNLAITVAGNSDQTVTLPGYLKSARVYIGSSEMTFRLTASGDLVEPSPVDTTDPSYTFPWGIVELDYSTSVLCADLSYVDSVGLALGMTLTAGDGTQYVDPGLPAGALKTVCDQLEAVNTDWGNLCLKGSDGSIVRAVSPTKVDTANAGSLATLYDDYITQVWTKYESTPLTVNSQQTTYGPNVTCQVQGSNGTMVCNQPDGATYNYNKPTTSDVLGCNSGPFTAQGTNDLQSRTWPRLCAAFTRATLLLDGGDITPSSALASEQYYTGDAVNYYAKIVHETVTKGQVGSGAYAFAFDDVNAPGTGENESGTWTVDSAGSAMEIVIRGT